VNTVDSLRHHLLFCMRI